MDGNKTEVKRSERGTFVEGTAPGPGRPPGSISIIGKIKQKFEQNPEYFDEWVDKLLEDAGNRRAIMEQIDGKPHQTTDVTSGGKALPTPILYALPSDDGAQEDKAPQEAP